MRIGELAALVGVSTRTVRHYHHQGLMPEPARLANGYREYGLRDAVTLARTRRLVELGLSLDEIRTVLADDHDRELRDVLLELDADLARQQAELGARRERLATLLSDVELCPDSVSLSADVEAVLDRLPVGDSAFAELDRDALKLIASRADPSAHAAFAELFQPLTEPEAAARGHELNARLDELAGAAPDDPRIAPLVRDLAAHLPEEMAAALARNRDDTENARWLDLLLRQLPAAQAAVIRLLMLVLADRGTEG
jgi:DNA-binding transcriptional MerR regulator